MTTPTPPIPPTPFTLAPTLWIALGILLAYHCCAWRCGPLYVLQVWLVALRSFLAWLRSEMLGGIISRWPRHAEIHDRIWRGGSK